MYEGSILFQVVAQIVGEELLPWEDGSKARELLKTAGRFRSAIVGLLEREPSKRLSIKAFMQHCSGLLFSTTRSTRSTRTIHT